MLSYVSLPTKKRRSVGFSLLYASNLCCTQFTTQLYQWEQHNVVYILEHRLWWR